MVSIKDYARDCGVSYEAVRKQIKRFEEELRGHIHQQGRVQLLDDVAVAFLNEHRAPQPVVIYDQGTNPRMEELEAENRELEKENADLWRRLDAAKDKIIELQPAQAKLQAAEDARHLLEESRDSYKAVAEQREAEVSAARQEAAEAKAEVNRLLAELAAVENMNPFKRMFWKR